MKQTRKVFYKFKYWAELDAMYANCEEWISIHETKCMHFCISKSNIRVSLVFTGSDLPTITQAKKSGFEIKRIHKSGSRFAFETKEEAFEKLLFLKRKQNNHLLRQLKENELLLSNCSSIKEAVDCGNGHFKIPNTEEYCKGAYYDW